jgi:hypothetical protein
MKPGNIFIKNYGRRRRGERGGFEPQMCVPNFVRRSLNLLKPSGFFMYHQV